jgi:cytochrome c-type biogenesis protein CcmH
MTMRFACLFLLLLLPSVAGAVQPSESLADPKLEMRAREISADLRCLVCQNQSIDDSDADLAHDLRVLVRQRLQAGDSDEQVKQYLVDRYGDYVLLTPPFKAATVVLWLGPPVLAVVALGAAFTLFRRRRKKTSDPGRPLSAEEQRRVEQLMDGQFPKRKRTSWR